MKGITMCKWMVLFVVGIVLVGSGFTWAEPPATATASATQPSKVATERAEALKKDIKNFTLSLNYYGKGKGNLPLNSLFLSVPAWPGIGTGAGGWSPLLRVQITEDQAKKIIDYLATEGFLDRAELPGPTSQPAAPPKVSDYVLSLSNGLREDIGWGLPMLQRLDGLRKVLEGNAAKDMDTLLERMAEERKEWTKAAATQPAASKPVEKDADGNTSTTAVAPLKLWLFACDVGTRSNFHGFAAVMQRYGGMSGMSGF